MSLIRDYYIRFQLLVHEVAKFGVVGAVGFVVQLGAQNALHSGAGLGPQTALVIAYVLATMVTFVGNRYWAFKHRKGKGLRRESVTFVVLNCIGIGVATLFRLYAYRKFVFLENATGGGDQADELASASVL